MQSESRPISQGCRLEYLNTISETQQTNTNRFSWFNSVIFLLIGAGIVYGFTYSVVKDESIIENTKSVLATYESAFIDNKKISDIKLSIIHHYDKQSFINYFQNDLKLKYLKSWTNSNATLFLFLHP